MLGHVVEAGADASIPFEWGTSSMPPLQMACANARKLTYRVQSGLHADDAMPERRRAQAMEVASELLKWHKTRSDGCFDGITDLHLACRMGLDEEIEHLLSTENAPLDPKAKARWPGFEFPVTARELIRIDIQLEVDVVCQFPVYNSIMYPLQESLGYS
jgi:hypothetical protein